MTESERDPTGWLTARRAVRARGELRKCAPSSMITCIEKGSARRAMCTARSRGSRPSPLLDSRDRPVGNHLLSLASSIFHTTSVSMSSSFLRKATLFKRQGLGGRRPITLTDFSPLGTRRRNKTATTQSNVTDSRIHGDRQARFTDQFHTLLVGAARIRLRES